MSYSNPSASQGSRKNLEDRRRFIAIGRRALCVDSATSARALAALGRIIEQAMPADKRTLRDYRKFSRFSVILAEYGENKLRAWSNKAARVYGYPKVGTKVRVIAKPPINDFFAAQEGIVLGYRPVESGNEGIYWVILALPKADAKEYGHGYALVAHTFPVTEVQMPPIRGKAVTRLYDLAKIGKTKKAKCPECNGPTTLGLIAVQGSCAKTKCIVKAATRKL